MVLNHMCINNYTYPRFSRNDFHTFGAIQNWNDQWQVENGSLVGLEDLAQESSYVRGERYKDVDTMIFSRGEQLLAGINQRGSWVNRWVQTPWVNTQIHDYTGHVEDERTNQDGWVELWIPPQGYVMMAPLR